MSTLEEQSRFQFQKQINLNGVVTYGSWVPPWFIQNKSALTVDQVANFVVPVAYAGRPDNIAMLLYGSPLLDWVIVMFNKPLDVLNWPAVGEVIQYPIKQVVIPYVN